METKYCKRCEQDVLKEEFRVAAGYKDGVHPWCKTCRTKYQREYRRKTPTAQMSPEYHRNYQLKKTYNISLDQFNEMLEKQDNCCAACGISYVDGERSFHVDHNHGCCPGNTSCGSCIRGLLCGGCNTALGMTKDNPATLRALADYIEDFAF